MDFIYSLIKLIHMSCAALSITGFILRGIWMMNDSSLLNKKIVKVLPHIIDTFFFSSGVCLVFLLGNGILTQSWLLTKLALLPVYIVFGFLALSKNMAKPMKTTAFFVAIAIFSYIVGVALMKSPASWPG